MYALLFLFYAGCLFFLSFSVIVRQPQSNRFASKYLALFFVCLSMAFLAAAFKGLYLDRAYPHIYKIFDFTAFAISPALFLAVHY